MSVHFIVSTTIPFLLFAALAYAYTLTHFKTDIDDKNNSSAKLIVSIVEEEMHNIQSSLQNCAKAIEKNKNTAVQTEIYLQAIIMANPAIHQVRLLNNEGIVYALSPFSKDVLGMDMSNYPSFKNAYVKKTVYWSPAIISATHRTPVFQISIPVQNGVLIANVTFPNLNSLIKELNIGEHSILAVTDQTGTYIAHTDETQVLQRTEDPHFKLFKDISGKSVRKESIKNDKNYDTAYAASIGPSRWVALIYQNSKEVYRDLITYTIAFTTLALLILFLGMIVLLFRLKTIGSNFNELVSLAAQVSRGDYSRSATPKDIREFDEIATAFGKMSSSIESREQEINTLNRDLAQQLSEMQKLRSLLSNIINSMPSVLIAVDSSTKIIQWNAQAELESGIRSKDAAGRALEDVYPRLSSKMADIRTAMHSSKPRSEGRLTHLQDGRTYHEDITIYPLESNGIEGAVIRLDDVTDKVRLEQIMVQSEKMMSLGGLAAGMAHEINNPLAGISGNIYNMQKRIFGDLPANQAAAEKYGLSLEDMHRYLDARDIPKMMEAIKSSTNRASTIVRNMLSFSRKSEKNMEPQNIADLLDETIDIAASDYNLKKQFDFKKIRIVRDYSENIADVFCERSEIQQVFFNIMKNGAEAMKDKEYSGSSPCFTIKIYQERQDVTVQIEDNGPGINEKARSRIFEPFYTTKPVGKGTGLGLSVAYFIITEQHKGSMSIDSETGNWTRFTITLPVKQEN
ncbi:PAS domain-containing sensor histidine kinase [Desulfovibrio sp. JC010]|uniref:PAS domain-containing sensor histidine kinase n=1 Tax=Desulfovibrio sp. JC010 TaxID=2593641 RepID=UPI0013D3AF45|nr:PAS domain-containing sensor histidine kinase [Desulfovibrio sp. JC010]